jgi:hypothetical protein
MIVSPGMRDAVVRDLRKAAGICLARYTRSLNCINASLAGKTSQPWSGTNVLTAIIGLICYNVGSPRLAEKLPYSNRFCSMYARILAKWIFISQDSGASLISEAVLAACRLNYG